jgi:hypothetical protein
MSTVLTHAELENMARENLRAIAASASPPDRLKEIIFAHDVVFALFPSKDVPRGWDLHMIKGKKLVEGASDETIATLATTAVPCESLVEAAAMERAFGDGRSPAH